MKFRTKCRRLLDVAVKVPVPEEAMIVVAEAFLDLYGAFEIPHEYEISL